MSTRGALIRGTMATAGLTLATLVLTAPLAWRGHQIGPTNTGDGQLSIWNVAWVARTAVVDPLRVFDANIFAPHTGTLAYSEANLLAGVLGMPGWWLSGGNPYATYSSAVFLAFLLSAVAACALVRTLTHSLAAGIVAGLAFAFAPMAMVRLAHVQLLMTAGLPLTLLALHRLIDRLTVGRALALSAALVVAALGSGYYGIFAALCVSLGWIYFGIARSLWRRPRFYLLGGLTVVVAALAVLPVWLPYGGLARHAEPFRNLDEARLYAATWRSYVATSPVGSLPHVHRTVLGALIAPDASAFPERVLFPGFVTGVLACAAVGLAFARRRRAEPSAVDAGNPRERETVGFYLLLAAVAAWLSLGPAGGLYTLAYHTVPAWSMLRAPARFGMVVTLALVVLAGLATSRILAAVRRRRLAAVLLGTAVAVDLAAVPLDLRPALPVPHAHRLLAKLPSGAVAEFPFFFRPEDFHRHSLYMLHATAHWQPLVNGYSDHIPDDFRHMVVAVSSFPAREAFAILRQRGTRYVVFHLRLYDQRSREKLLERLARYQEYLRPLHRSDDVWLFEITRWPTQRP